MSEDVSWRRWIPHVALLTCAVGALALLAAVLWPVVSALLMAAAVVALTEPVLFRPVDDRLERALPKVSPDMRRWWSALIATSLLATSAIGGIALILTAILGSWTATLDAIIGVTMQDPARISATADQVGQRMSELVAMYGGNHLESARVADALRDVLNKSRVGTEFLHFLISGTGGLVAHAALVLVTTFYLFSQGSALVELGVKWLPLDDAKLTTLERAYRSTAYHLLAHLLGRAAAIGVGLGIIAWAIGGLSIVLVAVATTILALLPLVGPLVGWLPLAGLLWSRGDPGTAVVFAAAGWIWCWMVGRLFRHVATRLGTDQVWLEFLLFLGLVGGILTRGPAGLALGPAAVLAVIMAIRAVRLVYWPEDEHGQESRHPAP